MDTPGALHLLQQHGLLETAKKLSLPIVPVLRDCLAAKDEQVLVVTDSGTPSSKIAPLIAGSYFFAAQSLKLPARITMQQPASIGDQASADVIEQLSTLHDSSIILLSSSYKIGDLKSIGGSFRKFAASHLHRFASTSNLGNLTTAKHTDVFRAIGTDYTALQKSCRAIKQILDSTDEVHVTAPGGTDFFFRVKGKKAIANDGCYMHPGTGGNIPAGEVYLPPRGRKRINGTVVIDGSLNTKAGTVLPKTPVTMEIVQGNVVAIEGGEEAAMLEKTLDWASQSSKYPWGVRRIGELGIGLNPDARLIGATIVDEKVKGTAHIAIGSNHWFGGKVYSRIHLDQVFRTPSFTIDGMPLIIN